MRTYERRWLRNVVAVFSLIGLAPLPAVAQLAPVAGAHYDGTSSTGFRSGANSSGGYAASVPLDFPAARGGVPVPVQVVYDGKKIGAAGLGWEVPLSFISRSAGTARRRPMPQPFTPNQPPALVAPERWLLSLAGSKVDLVRNATNTAWVGRRGSTQIEVRSNGDGLMVAYDGEGRTYNFSSRGATAGSRLAGGDLYLLTSIIGASSGNRVELGYAIAEPALPGGGAGLAINLISAAYNQSGTTAGCYKHKVHLVYDTASAAPLSMTIFNGAVLARVQKLSSIVARSKDTCASSEKTLSTYTFSYQLDADTRLPHLQSVKMTGQLGTPEQNITLPVASYTYGSIVDPVTQKITYQKVLNAGPPVNVGEEHYTHGIGFTKAIKLGDDEGTNPGRSDLETQQLLADFNGDGRPDLINRALHLHLNVSGAAGPTQLINQGTTVPLFPKMRSQGFVSRYRSNTRNDTYTEYLDMNGDGRVDVVDAGSDPAHWIVYLNVPVSSDRSKSNFAVLRLSTARLRQALAATGINATEPVPLARRSTVSENPYGLCWSNYLVNGVLRWLPTDTGVNGGGCSGAPALTPRKRTITEFELKDINGDGYPDFVYNASYVNISSIHQPPAPNFPPPPHLDFRHVLSTLPSDLSGSRDVKVLINTTGAHLENGDELFSSPVVLEIGGTSGCGVGRWEVDAASSAAGGMMAETCAFQDVNGDGIADRVTTTGGITSAKLGTGNLGQPYLAAALALPGPLGRTWTDLELDLSNPGQAKPSACVLSSTFDTRSLAGLREVNGDGIPDYLSAAGFAASVAIGTGTGFAPFREIAANGLGSSLSIERNQCDVSTSPGAQIAAAMPKGLYDLDGDGQPEFVSMTANSWEVYQLKPPVAQVDVGGGVASVPAAGRLTRIDYGYGASTTIGYRSAKEEWNSAHHVPFPEIVVESVGTKDANNASLMSTTRYAYRGAEMIFDPAYDGFRFPGYRRSVALNHADGKGTATITDAHGLDPYAPGMSESERFGRYLKAGLTSDVTTVLLSGVNHDNPWDVLNVNIANDERRSSGTHYDWDVRLFPGGPRLGNNERCLDVVYPYDFATSKTINEQQWPNQDACTQHGFVFQGNVFSWRGFPQGDDALTSTKTLQTNTTIAAIDDKERVIEMFYDNDLNSLDDHVCIVTDYAEPTGTNARTFNAPFQRTVYKTPPQPTHKCRIAVDPDGENEDVVLTKDTFKYDGEEPDRVSRGLVTALTVSRLDSDTGDAVDPGNAEIRVFDATYDPVTGNPLSVTKSREDGASVKVTKSYDSFGLVAVGSETRAMRADGSVLPLQNTSAVVDATTLNVLSTTDPNGTKNGSTYDGFGRVVLSTLTSAGSTEGVMAKTTYNGFGIGQTGGRSIVQKVFTNPVPVANVNSAPGRSVTVFLDNLGRAERSEVSLGADYANQILVVAQRSFDAWGRVEFEADPFPLGQSFATAYGTTQHYHQDGMPQCMYRAYGKQVFALSPTTDEASERLVSCVSRIFQDNKEVISTRSADSTLAGSPQEHMTRQQTYSAIGRLLQDWTVDRATDAPFEESIRYGYSPLGHMISMTRQQPGGGSEMSILWRYDSLGQVIEFHDGPDAAPQYRRYDNWGALTATEWCDPTGASCSAGSFNRGIYRQFDALGRLLHSEERSDNAVLAETVRDFVYDQGVNTTTPPVTATHVLGRLAKATAATSSVSYSYDALGRTQAEVHTDRTLLPNDPNYNSRFVQKFDYHADGSMKTLHLLLPDTAYRDEKADYTYDSAGRVRSVKYSDGAFNKDLFMAHGVNDIDVLGRIRAAQYGVNTYTASYADVGRRLMNSVKVTSPGPMATSREFVFAGTNGVLPAYDPVGRERSRQEIRNGSANVPMLTFSYDKLGRLKNTGRVAAGSSPERFEFHYDAFGNVLNHADVSVPGLSAPLVTMSYEGDSSDVDRLCSIGFNGAAPGPVCNVKYDGVGSVVEMPTRNGGKRRLSYFPGGSTKVITQSPGPGVDCPAGGVGAPSCTVATYDYDAFGNVQRLILNSPTEADTRKDKHFGDLLTQRDENGVAVLTRKIAGPGMQAMRHGPTGAWTFTFGEQRGNRFVTDQNGVFVQDIHYQPYGGVSAALSGGALPGSTNYTSAQWNGGDALAALGVSQLGARIYDPLIGRFLSRDPLIIPRTAATTNAYAFAMNDPINKSDPTGLDTGDPEPDDQSRPQCEGCGEGETIIVSGSAPHVPKPGDQLRVGDVNRGLRAGMMNAGAGAGIKWQVDKALESLELTIMVLYGAGQKESQEIEDQYISVVNNTNLSKRERDMLVSQLLLKNQELNKAMEKLGGALSELRNSMRGVSSSGPSATPAAPAKVGSSQTGNSSRGTSNEVHRSTNSSNGSPMWMLTSERALMECALTGYCFEGVQDRPPGY